MKYKSNKFVQGAIAGIITFFVLLPLSGENHMT